MKQKFSKVEHKKFQNLFNINKYPTLINISFIEKTKNYLKFIKWIPWLKMIWISNSVSMNCNNENSDIDLFIITKKNRLWIVRIIITLIFSVLMVRKTKNKHKKRFCLSFFTTTLGMDFSTFALKNDIYLYFWIIYMKPILDYDNTYQKFLDDNSSWIDLLEYKNIIKNNKNYIYYKNEVSLPNWVKNKIKSYFYYPILKLKEKILNLIDLILKKIFLPITIKHNNLIWNPYWIIINDEILKFHNNDIRKNIKKELDWTDPQKVEF